MFILFRVGLVSLSERSITKDNFEFVFGVNHFGHFLLTNLLLDLLRKSAPSRVVTVSSDGHKYVRQPLDFSRYQDGTRGNQVLYPHLHSYLQANLASVLFSRELARRFRSAGVTSVSLDPGVVYTSMFKTVSEKNFLYTLLYYVSIPFIT